jgi:hypothetical protein
LQDEISTANEELEQLNAAIADGNEQILLWERKIALAQEMKAHMKPADGNSEAAAMEAEIHRMQVRLGQVGRVFRLLSSILKKISPFL